jgi:hypothetical protein
MTNNPLLPLLQSLGCPLGTVRVSAACARGRARKYPYWGATRYQIRIARDGRVINAAEERASSDRRSRPLALRDAAEIAAAEGRLYCYAIGEIGAVEQAYILSQVTPAALGASIARQLIRQPYTPPASLMPISTEMVAAVRNLELQRALLEAYGLERYMRGAGGRPVCEDDYGRLWLYADADAAAAEPILAVEVRCATHPDQTYMIRVPPTIRTPHEAVAWSFRRSADEYRPTIQT